MRLVYFPLVSGVLLLAIPVFGPAPSAAFDAKAGPLAEVAPVGPSFPPSCPADVNLVHILLNGGVPESDPAGACLLQAAGSGNVIAARMLGDAYAQALARGASAHDLFGREILWRRAAAASGKSEDEIRLAQAFDFDHQARMPDQALAHYIRAAQHGAPVAADVLAEARVQGRISSGQIADFRMWVHAQAPFQPGLRRAAERLDYAEGSGGASVGSR